MVHYVDSTANMGPSLVALLLSFTACVDVAAADADGVQCDGKTEFACANGDTCVALELVNNAVNDCGDNSDEAPVPCLPPLFSCSNNRCAMTDWVLDGFDDCLDGSDEAKLVGTNCSTAVNCCFCHVYVPHSSCVDQLCQCDEGYYSNRLKTACIPRLVGDACESEADCSVLEGGFCGADGRCSCPPGHFPPSGSFVCTTRRLGDSCLADEDCTEAVDNSRCDDVNMTCECDVIAGYQQLDDTTCDIRELGEACLTDSDCQEAIENSWCMDSSPDDDSSAEISGICVCQDGFLQVGLLQCRYFVIGDDCTTDLQCQHSINNSRCRDGYCSCLSGYRQDVVDGTALNTACVRRVIGDPCDVNTDCSDVIEFTECVAEINGSAICRCDEKHMPNSNGTLCDIRPTLEPYVPVSGPEWERCGPTATCRGINERCVARGSSSDADDDNGSGGRSGSDSGSGGGHCRCTGGFSRRGPHEPCRRVRSYEVRINCTWIAGDYELLPFPNWNYQEITVDVLENQRQESYYASRLQYSGIDVVLNESPELIDGYLSGHVVQFDDATPGATVTFAVYLEFNSTTHPRQMETVLRNSLNRSDGEVGISRIFADRPFEDSLRVSDLDECYHWSLFSSLNDCHDNASCDNQVGYYDCVCNIDFKDTSTDRSYRGRNCVAIDRNKMLEALEQTFKTAGCTDGACETSWDVVLIITGAVFSVLLLLLTVELIWRTRQLRREVMKRQRQKSEAPRAATRHGAARLTAMSFNPAQPLLVSARHSLPQSKHNARAARKSSELDNLKRPLMNADEECAVSDSDGDRLA